MKSHAENGFGTQQDFYTTGSEETVKSMLHIPAGMTAVQHSAILNPHQESTETKPIGVPGTTYAPSRDDQIWRSEGGHAIIMGNAAGDETLRIQSRHGATVELDSEGSIKMVSASGMHVSIGGDNQIVLTGDFSIVTNGDFKVKAGSVYFDCQDFNVMATGNMMENIQGSKNSAVIGDSHSTVQGDASVTVGGDDRRTTDGS